MAGSKRGISKAKQGCSRFKILTYRNNGPVTSSNLNEVIRFDDKTDEQIINESGYKTNRPIEVLIINPRRASGRIPRRLNKWIIYRRDKNPEFKGQNLTVSVITKRIREMWADEPEDVKEFYAALSRLAEKKHIEEYGADYKYRPGPSKKFKSKQGNGKKLSKLTPPSPSTTSSSSPELPSSSPITPLQTFSFLSPVSTTSSNFSESEFLESMESMQAFPLLSDITPMSPSSNSNSPAESGELLLDPLELTQTFEEQPLCFDLSSLGLIESPTIQENDPYLSDIIDLLLDPLESTQTSEEQPLCFDLSSLELIESPTIQENDQYLSDSIDLLSLLHQVDYPKENFCNDQLLYPDQLYPHQPLYLHQPLYPHQPLYLDQIHHPDQMNFDNDFTLFDQPSL